MIKLLCNLKKASTRAVSQAPGPVARRHHPIETSGPASALACPAPGDALTLAGVTEYLKVARVDHWFKNIFVTVGSLAAIGYFHTGLNAAILFDMMLALAMACGVSSVNYIINEILDAPFDLKHPVKRNRPIPSGRVKVWPLLLMAAGLFAGCVAGSFALFEPPLRFSLLALFVAGMMYNLYPVRTKDLPFLDVISESVNNPIRLYIGWFAVHKGSTCPPLSLALLFWVFGAYLMTAKRLAEFRFLGEEAVKYRKTFKHYSTGSLLGAMLFYGSTTLACYAWFALDHKPTLMYCLPMLAIFVAWFLKLTFEPDSFVKEPEKLFTRSPRFLCYCLATFAVFLIMPFV